MREGINDQVLEKIAGLQNRAVSKIKEITKGDKPFASEEIKWGDINNALDSISNIEMNQLIMENGFDAVNNLIGQARMNDRRRKV